MSMKTSRSSSSKVNRNKTKRTIKYLALCRNPRTCKAVLGDSSDGVIKCICNAALNAYKGDVRLSGAQKHTLARHRRTIGQLIDRGVSIKKKRRVLVQKGGLAFLPLLLTTVLGSVGSALFEKLIGTRSSSNSDNANAGAPQ